MQKIVPHLWYDTQAKEAAELYSSLFPDSKILNSTTIHDTPSGNADILTIELCGYEFMMINAGPYFTFNPSVSFSVSCESSEEVEKYWNTLIDGGSAMMELGSYPFADKYGWLTDKYGLSWQFSYSSGQPTKRKIVPTLMFVGDVCGKTEEAIKFYKEVFHNAAEGFVMRYEKGEEPNKEGTIKYASFTLEGQEFSAMDSALPHNFSFNEAISFLIRCETQEEINYYWEKLSAVPQAEQCGWLKDKFGLSWQVSPTAMEEMFEKGSPEQIERVTKAFLQMKKFDLAKLQEAYDGK